MPGSDEGHAGDWWLASDGNWYPTARVAPTRTLTTRDVTFSSLQGLGIFVAIGGLWCLLYLVATWTAAGTNARAGDNSVSAMALDALVVGVPVSWIAGLFLCRKLGRSRSAAAGAYLLASTMLNVAAIALIASEQSDLTIDEGGGAALVAIPMCAVAAATLIAGITLTAIGFTARTTRH